MPLENNWVRYVDRTYQQIRDRVLTDMQVLTPEITDHTESNPFVKMLSIWAGVAEMLGYYIDNAAREAHLMIARLYWSGVKIAKSYDYRIHSYLPSTGEVTFKVEDPAISALIIPANTELRNVDGIKFFTLADAIIPIGQIEVTTTVKQYEPVATTNLGVSTGVPLQEFVIDDNVVDGSVVVRVNGLGWNAKETLGYELGGSTSFVQTVNEYGKPIIRFGDDVNGKIPPSGSTITVEYQRTEGADGNTGTGTITEIVTPLTFEATCYNVVRTSGGSDVESLAQLKRRIPKANRTLMRAVTEQDFIDITELKAGVSKAGVYYSCGKAVDVYIVPDGGGVASAPLIADTQAWLNERRIITVGVKVLSAGEIRIKLGIRLQVLPQYTRNVVVDNVRTNLTNFLSFLKQEIGGEVQLSDIYEVIENTDGVKNSNIEVMKPQPYARPVGTNTLTLNWDSDIQNASNSNKKWQIKMISATIFELTRDNSMLGVFNVDDVVSFPEITFKVLAGAYTVGMVWEFYTYPFYGTIDLQEPSLPVSIPSDISIIATGGL